VGPEEVRFVVHETLLVHYSKFFRAALTGNFIEAQEKTVRMGEVDPDLFELFGHWLYYQRFPDTVFGDDDGILNLWTKRVSRKSGKDTGTENCIYLHMFGDKYQIEKLRLDTINKLIFITANEAGEMYPNAKTIESAFHGLPRSSPMLQLIIDIHFR
jgi:hypothetical protein